MSLTSKITGLTEYFLNGYIDFPSVIVEKTRVLLLANFGGLLLIALTAFNFSYQGKPHFVWSSISIFSVLITSILLIKKTKYIEASSLSLFSILIFDIFNVAEGQLAISKDMLIFPMSDVTLTLLLGFIFLGFISFKTWQIYTYLGFSIILLSAYYTVIITTKENMFLPQEIRFILMDYILLIIAGGLGVLLNLTLTNRLLTLEEERSNKMDQYNRDLELLVFERTTALNKQNLELEEKNKILDEQQKRIIESSKVKEQFLSSVSHELRTPLNAVVGLTNLLLNNDSEKDRSKNLTTLKYSTNSLLRIVNDILDFSKVETDQFEIQKKPFNIHEVLDTVHEVYKANASLKNLNFDYSLSSQIPTHVVGDGVRLNQILSNLLSNAIKFTDKGNVTFNITATRENDKNITIKFIVKDSGIGIKKEHQSKIFKKFTQLNEGKIAGTGLGLSIVKKMVQTMGGEIYFKSQFDAGSEFSILLAFPIFNKPKQNTTRKGNTLENKKVLLVEDNLLNQMIAKQILDTWNIDVHTANDGLEAVKKSEANKYDVILMDIQMPNMDGLEATSIIRKQIKNANTPIIALTANTTQLAKQEALDAGMNNFLGKPFKIENLQEKLEHSLYL